CGGGRDLFFRELAVVVQIEVLEERVAQGSPASAPVLQKRSERIESAHSIIRGEAYLRHFAAHEADRHLRLGPPRLRRRRFWSAEESTGKKLPSRRQREFILA